MDPHPNDKIEHRPFSEIKRSLDPTKTYIVFEHDSSGSNASIFREDLSVFDYLKSENMRWQQFIDPDRTCEYLVIETSHEKEKIILGKMMGYPFSDHIVYYIYNQT